MKFYLLHSVELINFNEGSFHSGMTWCRKKINVTNTETLMKKETNYVFFGASNYVQTDFSFREIEKKLNDV